MEWIPVREGEPSFCEPVLVWTEEKECYVASLSSFHLKWYLCDLGGGIGGDIPNVTHWMPLPEPPKEEDNGE